MKITDLDNLTRDNNSELYDLRDITFTFRSDIFNRNKATYTVGEFESMRLDLVCEQIYDNVDNLDVLCDLNNIFNPLSIKAGMQIDYVGSNVIPGFRPDRDSKDVSRRKISNERKKNKIDTSREDYKNDKNNSLPPSVTKRDYSAVSYKDGKVSIGEGIFGA